MDLFSKVTVHAPIPRGPRVIVMLIYLSIMSGCSPLAPWSMAVVDERLSQTYAAGFSMDLSRFQLLGVDEEHGDFNC